MIRFPVKTHQQNDHSYKETDLADIVNDAIYDLSFEWFEYDSAIARHELCLARRWENHAFSNVQNGDDGDDVAELAGTCAFNV